MLDKISGFATKLAPVTDLLNPWVGAAASYLGSRSSAKMSQASADQQMAFQASQTGTGYERAMADMKRAGLNPMLAAKLGPAASGSGAMASIPDYGQAVQRGASAAQASASVKKINQEIKNLGLDEVAKGLSNTSKEILVDFEKSLSKPEYKMYKMGMLKMLADVLGVPDVAEAATKSGLGKQLGKQLADPFIVIENAFKYVTSNSESLIKEYGQPVYVEFVKAWRKFTEGE